jgi:hypothetical protein
MRRLIRVVLPTLSLLACACDGARSPSLSTQLSGAARHQAALLAKRGPTVYGGKTADQWGRALQGTDREQIIEACRALHVLGREGRQQLLTGLDSSNPEARRLCLDTLTIADFKGQGDSGRQKLVTLSGDRDDMRIRERAVQLLGQWHGSVPAP